jgi:pimeloyl-ACP methyl ester carboxylesterase
MQIKVKTFIQGIFIVMFIVSLSSCHKLFNNKDDEPEPKYLVSYEMVRSYLPLVVESLFDQLVKEYPDLAPVREKVKHGIIIYKITYKTTFQGESIIASGLVCVPTGQGSFPVISYQNGTNTLHKDAPSVNPNYELYVLLETVASTGFVISLPDYLGFGASANMFHPYLHKESTVQSVLDMLRAVEELARLRDVGLNGDLYLTGYSLGGWATMQVQKAIEQNFSSEFNLKASAPAAGPYDLNFINEYILGLETYPMPYFIAYMLNSYINLGEITAPAGKILNQPYDTLLPVLFDGTKSGEEINEELTTNVADLFTSNYRQNFKSDTTFTSLLAAMQNNSVTAWNTNIPTRIIHGTADSFVPMTVSSNIYRDFLATGANNSRVQMVPLPGLDHLDAVIPSGLFAIQWFLELSQ